MRASALAWTVWVALSALALPWPDDWDAVGFALAVERFDLARWQPHAPGYPLYVLAARAVNLLARHPAWSCGCASALGAALAVWALARRGLGAWSALLLASPVFAHAATTARSDALGLGLAAAAWSVGVDARRAREAALAGALLAMSSGARPSLAALHLALALAALARWRGEGRLLAAALASCAAVTTAWLAWLARAAGGVEALASALRAQASGHFHEWGGSAWTQPQLPQRARDLALDVALGLGWRSPAGALVTAALLAAAAWGARRLGAARAAWWMAPGLAATAAAFVTQNLAGDARHCLPLTLSLLALAAEGARGLAGTRPRAARWAAAALCASCGVGVALGRAELPPGVAMGREAARVGATVFGGRSARLAEWAGAAALPRGLMGEVDVTLERLPRLPRAVWVTDEVAFVERGRGRVIGARSWCREAPWRRARECVTARVYDVTARR